MRNTNPIMDIFFILVGLIFIGFYLIKDKITSTSDLVEINGTVLSYSFDKDISIRSTTYNYFIYLKKYSPGFQISADFANYFDKTKFEQSIKNGDSLKIFISKYDMTKINAIEKVLTFGISTKTNDYLNPKNVINKYNSITILIFGILFTSVSTLFLYFDIKRRKKIKLEKENN